MDNSFNRAQREARVGEPLNDDALEALVDELLASPHYGERWGRHWLDIARYGESDGFERNNPRKNLWPYRDWVIESLNADMPYDEFVRMQLAGDISHPGATAQRRSDFWWPACITRSSAPASG